MTTSIHYSKPVAKDKTLVFQSYYLLYADNTHN